MRNIFNLFAKSPFGKMQEHMARSYDCAAELPALVDGLVAGDHAAVVSVAKRISKLEHDADVIKNEIRNSLPRSVFLPVDRRDLLELLAVQDAIADKAEDVGVLLTLRPLTLEEPLAELVRKEVEAVMVCVRDAWSISKEIESLKETAFGGAPALKVIGRIDALCEHEHEADKLQDQLSKRIFSVEDQLKPGELLVLTRLATAIGDVGNMAERWGNRLRLLLAS